MNFVLKKDPQTSRLRAVGSFREQIQDEQEQCWFLLSASHPWPWHIAPGAKRACCLWLFSWGLGRWHRKQIYPWRSGPQCGCTGSLQLVCTRADVPVRSSTRLWGSSPCYEEKPPVPLQTALKAKHPRVTKRHHDGCSLQCMNVVVLYHAKQHTIISSLPNLCCAIPG